MSKKQTEYRYADELIDAVMEYIARKWTKSMIRRELREWFEDITLQTCNYLIGAAYRKIRDRYHIDPDQYKGQQVAFYESLIRDKHVKAADQLKAAERLDKLLGLENISSIDPAELINKILDFKQQAIENTTGGIDDGGNTDEGNNEIKAETSGDIRNTGSDTANAKRIADGAGAESTPSNSSPTKTSDVDGTGNKKNDDTPKAQTADDVAAVQKVVKELNLKGIE